MQRTLRVLLPLCFLLPSTIGIARAGEPDNWSRVVSVGDHGGVIATGAPWKVEFSDRLVGPPQCHEDNSGCEPRTVCDNPSKPNPSTLEAMRCEGAGCSAVRDGNAVAVTGKSTGTAHVSFDLRDESGDVRHVAFDLQFAEPKALNVTRKFLESPYGARYASLPGATHTFCFKMSDEHGMALRFVRDALVLTTTGPASTVTRDETCDSFEVTDAGEVVTTYQYGDFTRVDHLTVVSPDDIESIDIVDLEGIDVSEVHAIEDDVLAAARTGSSIDAVACKPTQTYVLARARTKSGAVALLPGRVFTVAPAELASIEYTGREQPIVELRGAARGEGTLEAEMNDVKGSAPLEVREHCVPPLELDAGTEAGADADQSTDASADSDARPSM